MQQNMAEIQHVVEDSITEGPSLPKRPPTDPRDKKSIHPMQAKSTWYNVPNIVKLPPEANTTGTPASVKTMSSAVNIETAGDPERSEQSKGSTSGEWEQTREQKRRIQRKQRRNDAVIGKRTDRHIKSGLKNIDIFIFRVHCDVKDDTIQQFMTDENVSVVKFEKVSHEDSLMKSYKVTIKFDDLKLVMDEDFWPDGIGCRKFYSKRKE
jgi:hypothetical protein